MTDKIFALTIYIAYNGPNVYPKNLHKDCLRLLLGRLILGDPGAIGSGEKTGRKFSSTGERAPWLPTLTELFPTIQADAGSWLGS